jgi:hypothetical protein
MINFEDISMRNAFVPPMAFLLSTLTLGVVKSYWMAHVYKKDV